MAQTSSMLPLGTEAPAFQLQDVTSGQLINLDVIKSPVATVIMFICNHCPYVKHIIRRVVEVTKNYQPKGISFVAINSNDIATYPEDDPEHMRTFAKQYHFSFPYLLDEDQEIARAYQAECTPEFYIFDSNQKCVYHGRFDDATPKNNKPVTGSDLIMALDCLLMNKSIDFPQYASIGCNIKWKPSD